MSGVSEGVLEALARHSSSTTPSAPTSSGSPAPPGRPGHPRAGARPSHASAPRSNGSRRYHRRRRVRRQRPPRHPRHQPARTRAVLRTVRRTCAACEPRLFIFLDPRAETFYADWDRAARETAAILRSAAGRPLRPRPLRSGRRLATQSEAFRTHWAAHNVRFHATAVKHFHHPVVGELSLSFNRLDIAADDGLTLFTYAAEPGSATRKRYDCSEAGQRRPTEPRRLRTIEGAAVDIVRSNTGVSVSKFASAP